jgi:predicted AAA+ superfamily ATPase
MEASLIDRTLEPILRTAAESYPVVTVTGPRQAGKTTLVRMAFPEHSYVSLEDPELRGFALEDPRGFLDWFSGKAILDEAQRAPDLFSYIQVRVDVDDQPGHYILSGSQNFLLHHRVSQTLAGRCAVLHLLPFSLSELEGRKPFDLASIGRKPAPERRASGRDLMQTLYDGFYPRIHDKALPPSDWLRNYFLTYIERDVRELLNIGDIDAFERFVRLCAGRNGMLLNLSSLASDCGISHTTARRWISIMEAAFLIVLLRPHFKSFSKRLIKSPKLYFLDTGLLCYLLRIGSPEDIVLHAMRGSIFESFVVSEFTKTCLHHGIDSNLYFWRNSSGKEVDVLLDWGATCIPVEIKSAKTIASDFFDGLAYWRNLAGDPKQPAALIYGGNQSLRRSNAYVYSWAVL